MLDLRPLHIEDVATWHTIQSDGFSDGYSLSELEKEYARPFSQVIGAYDEGQLVAVILSWLVADEMQILQVIVASSRRRQGLGKALVQHAMNEAKQGGACHATLELRATNPNAMALYTHLGFGVDGRRPRYYDHQVDAILMSRPL